MLKKNNIILNIAIIYISSIRLVATSIGRTDEFDPDYSVLKQYLGRVAPIRLYTDDWWGCSWVFSLVVIVLFDIQFHEASSGPRPSLLLELDLGMYYFWCLKSFLRLSKKLFDDDSTPVGFQLLPGQKIANLQLAFEVESHQIAKDGWPHSWLRISKKDKCNTWWWWWRR